MPEDVVHHRHLMVALTSVRLVDAQSINPEVLAEIGAFKSRQSLVQFVSDHQRSTVDRDLMLVLGCASTVGQCIVSW